MKKFKLFQRMPEDPPLEGEDVGEDDESQE